MLLLVVLRLRLLVLVLLLLVVVLVVLLVLNLGGIKSVSIIIFYRATSFFHLCQKTY
jgi:hypothetical protein